MFVIFLEKEPEPSKAEFVMKRVIAVIFYLSILVWLLTIPVSMMKNEYSMIPLCTWFFPFFMTIMYIGTR
jgi:hypothetical protein